MGKNSSNSLCKRVEPQTKKMKRKKEMQFKIQGKSYEKTNKSEKTYLQTSVQETRNDEKQLNTDSAEEQATQFIKKLEKGVF